MTIAIIDGDIIAYTVASTSEGDETFGVDTVRSVDEEALEANLETMLNEWQSLAGCSERVVMLTGSKNFRKLVDPTYKSNRKDKVKPMGLEIARSIMVEKHGAKMVEGLEADDLIGLSLTGSMADTGVAVSIDKDLRTIPGWHFNPRKDQMPVRVVEEDANRFWMTQTLTGDVTDGYPGCPGIGPVKAAKILEGKTSLNVLWSAVVQTFKGDVQAALTQARLARILRRGDYDKATQEVVLWHPTSPERLKLEKTT